MTIRVFLRGCANPTVDPVEPSTAARDEAWRRREDVVRPLAADIRKPDPRAVPATDPANTAAFVATMRAAA